MWYIFVVVVIVIVVIVAEVVVVVICVYIQHSRYHTIGTDTVPPTDKLLQLIKECRNLDAGVVGGLLNEKLQSGKYICIYKWQ